MAVWVDCTSAPNYFRGFAADMGEYTGPWPLMPTAVTDGLDPVDGDEIDFVLGYDNPAHPGDVYYALDDSYDSPIWGTYRYVFTGGVGSGMRWYTGQSGAGPEPDGSTPPPAGVHLWVVSYVGPGGSLHAPTPPPEAYVPTSYTATGAAATETFPGGWSAWQDGLPVTGSATYTNAGWNSSQVASTSGPSGSVTTEGQAAIDACLAAAVWGSSGAGALDIFGSKLNPLGGDPGSTNAAIGPGDVAPGQQVFSFAASASNPDPTSGMTFDVDYGDQPFTYDEYEFDAGDPTFDSWSDLTGTTNTFYHNRAGSAASQDVATAWRVQTLTSVPASSSTGIASGGTTLGDISVGGPGTPTDGAPDDPFAVSLPATNPLHVMFTPAFLFDGAGSTSFPDIAPDGVYALSSSFALDAQHGGLGFTAITAQWHYWLPNYIGPSGAVKWHTVGGHWATVGGATLQILTPGVGWVDVVDGPA